MCDEQSQGRPINISVDSIEINQSKLQKDPKQLQLENKMIRRQNVILKKQLMNLSCRLDQQINTRLESKKKESSSDEVTQLQLQNSYKKCQIYKRQAMVYRKKYQSLTQDPRFEDFQRKIVEYQKQNLQLKNEIKFLNKIIKSQSQGLTELGFQGYPSLVMERDHLKEEVRILKKQLAQYRRSVEDNKKSKISSRNDQQMSHFGQESIEIAKNEKTIDKNLRKGNKNEQKIQKNNSKIETEQFQRLPEKENQKMKLLQAQNNKLRDLVDNLKIQITEKQKENSYLRDKINELRTNNHLLQSSVAKSGQNKIKKIKIKQRYESQRSQQATAQLKPSNAEKVKKKSINKKTKSEAQNTEDISISKSLIRRQNVDSRNKGLIKWNHQHLSSKIIELQILEHQQGHIKDIHVRYVKGQPKKYSSYDCKNNYKIFACSSEEYIKYVQGVFDRGYLQYLIIISNYKRVQKYGKFEFYQNCFQGEHFKFQVGQDGFPGALFGQKDAFGIIKLGCFVHKES